MQVHDIRESFQGKLLCYLDIILSMLSFKVYGKHLSKLRFNSSVVFFTIAFKYLERRLILFTFFFFFVFVSFGQSFMYFLNFVLFVTI